MIKNYSDCDKAPDNYGVKANYSRPPVGGKYENGTKVEFTCEKGNSVVYGSSVASCLDRKWTPELGRCPYLCSIEDLEKEGNFLYVRVDGQTQNQKWYPHGTKGRTHYAYYGFEIWLTSKYREWICVDGGWRLVSNDWHYS
ncbi:unnamed protein product [Heligmosomoides polygyrus]|uniref:Sushi domain-containing protein n=1 Tax=Heligmosomoides polygyrus TaxID=6339 RepID=A0A183GV89_HELPZ|nr:unnamed protein product [Heligmosomoides polygyrus]